MKNLYAILLLVLVISCTKEQFYTFQWVKDGNTITFNFVSDTLSENAALIFEVGVNSSGLLRFQFTYPLWGSIPNAWSVGGNYNIVRESDGIHIVYPKNCGFSGTIFSSDLNSLRIPAKPNIGDSYVEYYCGNSVTNFHHVIEIKEVTVPMGTFPLLLCGIVYI